MLRDVSQLDMRVKLLGEWVEFPICVAPTGCHKFIHPDGEIATAQGKATYNLFLQYVLVKSPSRGMQTRSQDFCKGGYVGV